MLIGADKVLAISQITIGRRKAAVTKRTSFIRARPCDAVAVITLAPAAAAAVQALAAECSDSTGTNSVSTKPSATNCEKI
jgi:hypothetical protein